AREPRRRHAALEPAVPRAARDGAGGRGGGRVLLHRALRPPVRAAGGADAAAERAARSAPLLVQRAGPALAVRARSRLAGAAPAPPAELPRVPGRPARAGGRESGPAADLSRRAGGLRS